MNVVKLKGAQLKLSGLREEARSSIYPEDFLWFWSEYPKKKAKLDALKAWRETEDLRPEIEKLMGAIEAQKAGEAWSKGYIPHPATWLRSGRWDDEE